MEQNDNIKDFHEYDEISLKELIMTIINERRIIAIITMITLLLTVVYTFFLTDPVYEAKSEIVFKAPTPVETRYGTYTFPSENINDYIQYIYSNDVIDRVIKKNNLEITRAGFKSSVDVIFDAKANSNLFQVIVSNTDPLLAKSINDDLISQYIQSLRVTYKKNAIERFINSYEINIDNLQQSISQTEAILKETQALMETIKPIYTLQKALFADPKSAAAYADTLNLNLSDLSEHVMVEEYVNSNYFALESKELDYKTQLINSKESMLRLKSFYKELLNEREKTNLSESLSDITNGRLDVFSTNISVISSAYVPENPISPNKAINLTIGLVLGVMLGVFVGFFKAYWKSN